MYALRMSHCAAAGSAVRFFFFARFSFCVFHRWYSYSRSGLLIGLLDGCGCGSVRFVGCIRGIPEHRWIWAVLGVIRPYRCRWSLFVTLVRSVVGSFVAFFQEVLLSWV